MMKKDVYLSGTFAFKVDIGKVRANNEDRANALVNARGDVFLIVCDGMGGSQKGEYAATIAKDEFSKAFLAKSKFLNKLDIARWIFKQTRIVNKLIFGESEKDESYNGMGTTLTIAIIHKDSMVVGQIGDSRCYIVKDQKLNQLTEDQSYVDYLYRIGQIKKEEMATHPKRHVLMNSLGIFPTSNVDVKIFNYNKEQVLLCSDGLYNNVNEPDILNILNGSDTTDEKVKELISLANSNGGSDNISVVVWEASK